MILTRPVAGSPHAKYINCPSSVMETSAAMTQPGMVTTVGAAAHVPPSDTQCMSPVGPFQWISSALGENQNWSSSPVVLKTGPRLTGSDQPSPDRDENQRSFPPRL